MTNDLTEKIRKAESIAKDILAFSRDTLLVNLRFIDTALSRLIFETTAGTTMATDGNKLYYNPFYVLKIYKTEKEATVRAYLHIILHCIFLHMFVDPAINREYWDIACDIAVENIIAELDIASAETAGQQKQQAAIAEMRKEVKHLTAEKIYSFLQKKQYDESELSRLKELFTSDDHTPWYEQSNGEGSESGDDDQNNSDDNDDDNGNGESGSNGQNESDNRGDSDYSSTIKQNIQEWKDIAETVKQDLETFSKSRGDTAGYMMQNLLSVTREKYDYRTFLKRFAVMSEMMKVNDDEFDYIFYTYGLNLFGNMPLIEPLEYKEVKRIKDFVIAIDTSGSVAGETVQKFVQKTYNILKEQESFFTRINLYIIQCDATIQEVVQISTQEDFDSYLKNMKIRGLGGTDFRPVFRYVDELIDNKAFSNLKGIIYFSDGLGTFPEKKPAYQTAFIFLNDDYINPDVPSWVIKLVLPSDNL